MIKCAKSFDEVSLLAKHEVDEHVEVIEIECVQCSEVFADNNELRLHTNEIHTPIIENPSNFKCSRCKKVIRTNIGIERLLGLQISTDLRWADHTRYICKKANSRLWMLRRMKILNIEPEIILDFYFEEIRSILEMGCQIFHSGLTNNNQSRDFENIQKKL